MTETNGLLRDILEAMRFGQVVQSVSEPVQHGEIRHKLVALPSKKQQAIEWLQANPGNASRTGQDLETNVKPMDETISYRTWNRAKKELKT